MIAIVPIVPIARVAALRVWPRKPRKPSGASPRRPIGARHRKPIGGRHRRPIGGWPRKPIGARHRRPIGGWPRKPIGAWRPLTREALSVFAVASRVVLAIGLTAISAACAARPTTRAPARERIAIAIAERGDHGTKIVAIDERGDRRLDLVQPAAALARDTNPAISPDGAWLVFASSRGRAFDETSLWIAPLAPDAVAARLTTGPATDSHPAWTPDGKAIVFASTRGEGHQFDLYELAIARGAAAGEPRALTATPAHEITPAIASDGTIVYARVTPGDKGDVESHLEARAPDGTIAKLTDGPGDASPAVSPDGRSIAFARPQPRGGSVDGELWIASRADPATAHRLVDLPLTDESGPVWSRDGRFVLATSVLRGARGNVLFSSVIVIDTREATPRARILEDRTGAVARLTPAVAGELDALQLDRDPDYLPELARITAAAIARQQQAESSSGTSPRP